MTKTGSSLELRGIVKHFGKLRVLDNVGTFIEAGSFTAILGPSGSGKSTLLMTIAGFEMPDSGGVLRDGVDMTGVPAERRGIGVVFQGYALFPHLSVADNIAYPLRARRWKRSAVDERLRQMAGLMEIETLLSRYPAQLSGGQRQRVAIARALAFEPSLLLLDEPLSALDRSLRDRMKAELQRLHRRLGVTIVMVTHDQEEAAALADTVIVMENGAIIAKGTARQLYEEPANTRVAAFFGGSNFLPFCEDADGSIIVAGGYRVDRAVIAGSGDTLLVRPEALGIAKDGAGIPVEVVSAVFHAGRMSMSGLTDKGDVIVADLPDAQAGTLRAGERVTLSFCRARLVQSAGEIR